MPTVSTQGPISSQATVRRAPPADAQAPPDQQLVAEMRHEINAIVGEITRLAAEDIAPAEFFSGFLTRVVASMAASAGAVWTRSEQGPLELQHQINLAQTGVESSAVARTQHAQLVKSASDAAQAVVAPPNSGGGEKGAGNPTPHLLVLAPLVVDGESRGVVEVFQRPGGGPSAQRGYMRFVAQMAELAGSYLKSRRLRQLEENQSLWRELEGLVAALHRSLDVRETAYAVVNDGRKLIGCDRVSVALCTGSSCRIEAVSGLDNVDRRASEVQSLARLADAVLRTGEPLWTGSTTGELPPQIDRPLQTYVDRSHARLVAVLPLVASRPLGALVIEQFRDGRATESIRTRATIVAQHSAAALTNAIDHSSLFLLPVWKALGQITWLFRGRTLPKTLLVLGMALGGVYALAAIPTEFCIAARGKLQPAERREVFAPLDGVVARVPVEHGQFVERGAVLAELTSTDLDLQLAALLGRQTTNQERLAALSRALLDNKGGAARLTPADENRLAGEILQLRHEAASIEQELALVRQKLQQLKITSQQAGQVVTWKVRDLLLQRPVIRGQCLLTLANPHGPWEVELYLPERRLIHVQKSDPQKLEATFVLSSHPGQTFRGRVIEIEQSAEVRGEEGNTILVRVAIDKDELPPLHDQTTVTAKLHCGRTSIGYAWFCDVVETVQTKILFWLPT